MRAQPSAGATRAFLFGVAIDAVSTEQAVKRVLSMARQDGPCRYVVTPNVDHVLILQRNEALRRAYEHAALVVADGMPVVLAARLLGEPLPERVAGSDLVPALFAAASPQDPLRVFLLGAAPGVAERAARSIESRYRGVSVAGCYSPPFGFEHDPAATESIVTAISAARPDVLLVGLGAPKQEVWVHRHCARLQARVALCIGATIDFLAGEKPRAPVWMQRAGLEWVHRMATEPRRLGGRYARNAVGFPQLVWKEWRTRARASGRDGTHL